MDSHRRVHPASPELTQKQVEHLTGEMGAANAKRLGMERRAFMASSMGLATCFLASGRSPETGSCFGADMGRDAGMYRGWRRLLESGDEFIRGRIRRRFSKASTGEMQNAS